MLRTNEETAHISALQHQRYDPSRGRQSHTPHQTQREFMSLLSAASKGPYGGLCFFVVAVFSSICRFDSLSECMCLFLRVLFVLGSKKMCDVAMRHEDAGEMATSSSQKLCSPDPADTIYKQSDLFIVIVALLFVVVAIFDVVVRLSFCSIAN